MASSITCPASSWAAWENVNVRKTAWPPPARWARRTRPMSTALRPRILAPHRRQALALPQVSTPLNWARRRAPVGSLSAVSGRPVVIHGSYGEGHGLAEGAPAGPDPVPLRPEPGEGVFAGSVPAPVAHLEVFGRFHPGHPLGLLDPQGVIDESPVPRRRQRRAGPGVATGPPGLCCCSPVGVTSLMGTPGGRLLLPPTASMGPGNVARPVLTESLGRYELDNASQPTVTMTINGMITATRTPDGKIWSQATDHLGTPTYARSSGGDQEFRRFTPYGAARSVSTNVVGGPSDLTFTGQRDDGSLGVSYFGARYYDPTLGQFVQADVLPDGLNRYAYVGGDPLAFVDPNGYWGWSAVQDAVGSAASGLWQGSQVEHAVTVVRTVASAAQEVESRRATLTQYAIYSTGRRQTNPVQSAKDAVTGTGVLELIVATGQIAVVGADLDRGTVECQESMECLVNAWRPPGFGAITLGHTVSVGNSSIDPDLSRHEYQHVLDLESVGGRLLLHELCRPLPSVRLRGYPVGSSRVRKRDNPEWSNVGRSRWRRVGTIGSGSQALAAYTDFLGRIWSYPTTSPSRPDRWSL